MDARAACRAVLVKLDVPGAHGDGWSMSFGRNRRVIDCYSPLKVDDFVQSE